MFYQASESKMKVIALVAVAFLAGCASTSDSVDDLSPAMRAVYDEPLICKGEEQCDLYWDRASFYINKHSKYKIQTSNENLIQTYSPTGGTPSVGYNISREPMSKGEYRLWVKVWCDNMFGCYPHVHEEIANVKKYISR